MNITDLKNKNTIMEGQVTQILLRELDMIYKQAGKCQLDIWRVWASEHTPGTIYIDSHHSTGNSTVRDCSLKDQLFILNRLPVGIKRLKRKLAKDNKSAAAVLDLYSQRLDSFLLPARQRSKVFGVFFMIVWTLWFAACSIWSRILF